MAFLRFLVVGSFLFIPIHSFGDIQFIGLSEGGREIHQKMGAKEVTSRLFHFLSAIGEKVNSVDEFNVEKGPMKMKKIYVGLGVGAALGVGNFAQASSSVGGYLIYERKKSEKR